MRLVAGVTHDLRSSGGEGLLYRASQRTLSVHYRKSALVWGHLVDRGHGWEGCRTVRSSLGVPRKRIGTRWGPERNMIAARRRGGAGWTEKEGRDEYGGGDPETGVAHAGDLEDLKDNPKDRNPKK
jgi:hypothetical protein